MIRINKIDKVVLKETAFVGAWTLIFSAIMQAVFLIIGKWNYTVLLGNVLSSAVGVLNFFLLCLTVQKAFASADPKRAPNIMRVSQALRLLLVAAVATLGATLDCFNLWATLIPLLFTRLTLIIRQIMLRKVTKAVKEMTAFNAMATAAGADDENENGNEAECAAEEGGEAVE